MRGGCTGVPGFLVIVPSLSVCPLAPEQQEAQKTSTAGSPQALQPAQQATEARSTGCESPQGNNRFRSGGEGLAGKGGQAGRWEVGQEGKPPPHLMAAWAETNWGWVFGCLGICPENFREWAGKVISGTSARGGRASPGDCVHPPLPITSPAIPRFSSLWTGRQVVEKALWNQCVGVGREEDLGLES